MKNEIVNQILRKMLPFLDNAQLEKLKETLLYSLHDIKVVPLLNQECVKEQESNDVILQRFIAAKKIEGCSAKTLCYYETTLQKMFPIVNKHAYSVLTDDIRKYLADYQKVNNCSAANIDNIRRIISSFFSWLEDENLIIKSPVRRIHKIRTEKTVKDTFSDEALEVMRDTCSCLRDVALIDLLSSAGIRVGELVKLNISDIDFEKRECVVLGKGKKERLVYFDARTKIHLKNYIASRKDDNPALFVSLLAPYNRLQISGVEIRLRKLGRKLGLNKVHPHKFRRTLATRAIDKGMPIEQVQKLLGHAKIDTTMEYAMVDQSNVKNSHRKYVC